MNTSRTAHRTYLAGPVKPMLWVCVSISPKKYICVFQVLALEKLGMVSQHDFYFIKLFYIDNAFFTRFLSIFNNILFTSHNKIFKVGPKT